MTPEEIIEGNKIIALFMGWKVSKHLSSKSFLKKGGFHVINSDGSIMRASDQLKYHSSWEELIPVVDKIESTMTSDVVISKDQTIITFTRLNYPTISVKEKGRIENTYLAIVNFIKWYIT